MLSLPQILQRSLDVPAINWVGLPRRFMNPGELEVLIALVKKTPARVMIEFGVNEGRTAAAVIREVKSIELYVGIDVLPGYKFEKKVQMHEIPEDPGKLVRGDPLFKLILEKNGSLDLTEEDLPRCDVAFIDGDHSRKAILWDTELARKLVVAGGLIIWHDYHDLGTVDVRDVLHELVDQGEQITHVEGTWLAFQRVGKGW